MALLIISLILPQFFSIVFGVTCGANGVYCVSSNQYQTCYTINSDGVLSGDLKTCPSGQTCSTNGVSPCVEATSLSTCGANSIYCVSSTQYQTCYEIDNQMVLSGAVSNCPSGEICSTEGVEPCVSSSSGSPSDVTCGSNGVYCVSSTQYQTCYEINNQGVLSGSILTCPTGQTCVTTGVQPCIGSSTSTTTTLTPSTTSPPNCSVVAQEANFTASQCNQYYHCLFVMWWWDYELLTCPTGQAFISSIKQCANSTSC